jgi:hypothetical protein
MVDGGGEELEFGGSAGRARFQETTPSPLAWRKGFWREADDFPPIADESVTEEGLDAAKSSVPQPIADRRALLG